MRGHMFGGIKALWKARKGFRWSLYFVQKGHGLRYAMHEHSVYRLLGYVMGPIETGKVISPDWEVHLNFNLKNKSIRLHERHFSQDDIDRELIAEIETIDPGFMVQHGKPVFVDVVSDEVLPLGPAYDSTYQSTEDQLKSLRERFDGSQNGPDSNQPSFQSVKKMIFISKGDDSNRYPTSQAKQDEKQGEIGKKTAKKTASKGKRIITARRRVSTKERVLKELASVKAPGLEKNIVELNYVSEVVEHKGNVLILIKPNPAPIEELEALKQEAEKIVSKMSRVKTVKVTLTTH